MKPLFLSNLAASYSASWYSTLQTHRLVKDQRCSCQVRVSHTEFIAETGVQLTDKISAVKGDKTFAVKAVTIPLGYRTFEDHSGSHSVTVRNELKLEAFVNTCFQERLKNAAVLEPHTTFTCAKNINGQRKIEQTFFSFLREKKLFTGLTHPQAQLKLHNVVNFRAKRFRLYILFFLLTYFVSVSTLIFLIFDWNLIEPTTFFIGQFMVLWGHWHEYRYLGAVPFTWPAILHELSLRKALRKIV